MNPKLNLSREINAQNGRIGRELALILASL